MLADLDLESDVDFRVLISDEPQYFPSQNEFMGAQSYQPDSFAGIPKAHLTAAERKRLELASDGGCEYFVSFHFSVLLCLAIENHKHPILTVTVLG